jgi:hypothetical protein
VVTPVQRQVPKIRRPSANGGRCQSAGHTVRKRARMSKGRRDAQERQLRPTCARSSKRRGTVAGKSRSWKWGKRDCSLKGNLGPGRQGSYIRPVLQALGRPARSASAAGSSREPVIFGRAPQASTRFRRSRERLETPVSKYRGGVAARDGHPGKGRNDARQQGRREGAGHGTRFDPAVRAPGARPRQRGG